MTSTERSKQVSNGQEGQSDAQHGKLKKKLSLLFRKHSGGGGGHGKKRSEGQAKVVQGQAQCHFTRFSAPPRGTLDDAKLEYLTWRMELLFDEQSRLDKAMKAIQVASSNKETTAKRKSALSVSATSSSAASSSSSSSHETANMPCGDEQAEKAKKDACAAAANGSVLIAHDASHVEGQIATDIAVLEVSNAAAKNEPDILLVQEVDEQDDAGKPFILGRWRNAFSLKRPIPLKRTTSSESSESLYTLASDNINNLLVHTTTLQRPCAQPYDFIF